MTEPLPDSSNGRRIVADQLLGRDAFDLPDGVAYLHKCLHGTAPSRGRGHQPARGRNKARPWRIDVPNFFEPLQRARSLIAGLVGGDTDAVCSGVPKAWERRQLNPVGSSRRAAHGGSSMRADEHLAAGAPAPNPRYYPAPVGTQDPY
jgi:hypothetical protein